MYLLFESDAQTIASIYRARWDIEIFFKTIKQNLKIKRFIGYSGNVVKAQVRIAIIAYLLVSFYKFFNQSKRSLQMLFRLIQINLLERKPLIELYEKRNINQPGR